MSAADRFAIEDLFAVFHWALDTGDVEGFADCFVDGGRMRLQSQRGELRYRGRDELIAMAETLRAWDRFPGCQHFAGQLLIELDDDGQAGRARSFCLVAESRGEAPYALRFAGRSDDRLRRRNGRWLFEERQVRLWQGESMVNHLLLVDD
ncbi:nuclear transport factor 2 family protein [Aquabacterium sp.]|uniref:nuclear transport factor 2 family protein n=1 Tax=Aquabacterium sp. TaxID=1872578 RepID=UPI002CD4BCFD|nr:nuclear transport factor 2 family protein [Aquabacterium sp.]HSW06742.1 nuclear transport factor 2 family protein [Aquabacterium sp.]